MSRGLFIPPLGFALELAEDWTFSLYDEARNFALLKAAKLDVLHPRYQHADYWQLTNEERSAAWKKSPWRHEGNSNIMNDAFIMLTLREGSQLKVERIYIRQGQSGFDSVTFRATRWVSEPGDPLFKATKPKSLRFWVKLDDANKITFKELRNEV